LGWTLSSSLAPARNTAFQQVILGLHNTRDSFDQAELSQEIFTKRWVEMQQTIQRAPRLIARAAEQEARFGPGEGTIAAAQHAEGEWREVGHFFEDLWSSVGAGSRAVFARVSDFAGTAANRVIGNAQDAVNTLSAG
jgi:hypothetical protein